MKFKVDCRNEGCTGNATWTADGSDFAFDQSIHNSITGNNPSGLYPFMSRPGSGFGIVKAHREFAIVCN